MNIINIDIDSLNLFAIAPMSLAILGALSIILTDLFAKNKDKSLYAFLVILFLVFDLFTILVNEEKTKAMFDMVLIDGFSILAQIIIIVFAILFTLLSLSRLRFQEFRFAEYYAIYLIIIASFQFMVSSDSLILIFIALETSSLGIYTLIAMHNRSASIEASIKYFTMGSIGSAFFLLASMLLYASTGSLSFEGITLVLSQENFLSKENFSIYILVLSSLVFMLVALGFKLSLFPFHIWVPDVYQGSTSLMAGFLSIVPKMAIFIVALRFFEIFIKLDDDIVYTILYASVVLTMTIPNLIALTQTDVKRMLAYSSIANTGMAMATLVIASHQAIVTLFLYWILFAITNLGAFAMLWTNRGKGFKNYTSPYHFKHFSGFVKVSPTTALLLGMFLFSLAGLPPFSLFWAKLQLIASAVNKGELALAIIIIINSVIAAFYYLRPVGAMYLKDPDEFTKTNFLENSTSVTKSVVALVAFLSIISILLIEPLLYIIEYFLGNSGF